jgi:putative glutamine amidotransferase
MIVVACEDHAHAPPYVEAVVAGGVAAGEIRVVTPEEPPEDWRRLAAGAAGVMLCGGPDLEPWHYGEEPLAEAHLALLPALDAIELELLAGAREAGVPVWGVCRGLQTLNVFCGGSLWQDLALQIPGTTDHRLSLPRDALIHRIAVTAPDTSLGEQLARGAPLVNSRHHQAVRRLGQGLEVVAEAPDGVVEAVEWRGEGWWARAVQWHPENLLALEAQRQLWRAFAEVTSQEAAR